MTTYGHNLSIPLTANGQRYKLKHKSAWPLVPWSKEDGSSIIAYLLSRTENGAFIALPQCLSRKARSCQRDGEKPITSISLEGQLIEPPLTDMTWTDQGGQNAYYVANSALVDPRWFENRRPRNVKMAKLTLTLLEWLAKEFVLPVLDDLIIMQRAISSWRTDSMNIMSRSLTIAPLITMISSPLIIPARKKVRWDTGWKWGTRPVSRRYRRINPLSSFK